MLSVYQLDLKSPHKSETEPKSKRCCEHQQQLQQSTKTRWNNRAAGWISLVSAAAARRTFSNTLGATESSLHPPCKLILCQVKYPPVSIMHGMSLIHQNSSLRLISWLQHGTKFIVCSPGLKLNKRKWTFALGLMNRRPCWQSACFLSVIYLSSFLIIPSYQFCIESVCAHVSWDKLSFKVV